MEEEKCERANTLVEKILKDIQNVMVKNPLLYSFEIIPVDANHQNKSPVVHHGNCLGLESWCVKLVYVYCYKELMDNYVLKPKRKTLKYTSTISERLTKLLNVTLLLNPDLNTLWNTRRELVLQSLLNKTNELAFSKVVLSRKPKCNEAFAYRRWLVELLLKDENITPHSISNITNEELRVCETTAEMSPNNYHSWNHRMWLVKKLKDHEEIHNLDNLYVKEYEFSERWTYKHVSDYSGFHYRQLCINNIISLPDGGWEKYHNGASNILRNSLVMILTQYMPKDSKIKLLPEELLAYSNDSLVKLLLSDSNNKCTCNTRSDVICRKLEVLFREFELNNDWLRFYKHHETLWYHRRFIVHEILAIMYRFYGFTKGYKCVEKNVCEKCDPDNSEEMNETLPKMGRYEEKLYSNVLFKILKAHEERFLEEAKTDCKYYVERYDAYLRHVEGLGPIMKEIKI